MLRRHPLLGVTLLALVATAIGIVVVLAIDWFPSQASTAAGPIDTLFDVLLVVSVPIFVLVMAVALYSVFAFRARPGDMRDGAPIHGNTRLEIVWVTIPFIIVSILAGYGWVVLADVEERKQDTLTIDVIAQQFAWSFEYPEQGKVKSNQLVVPNGRPIRFRVHTKDVLHDFWVPHFRLKTDAVPGITTDVRVTPRKEGVYPVVCAELCGLGHATMRQSVKVIPPDAFEAWVRDQQQSEQDGGLAAAGGDAEAAGREAFTNIGCGGCHALADAGSSGGTGPSLDDLAARAAQLGQQRGLSPAEYVRQSIADPNAFVAKGFEEGLMPATYEEQLTAAEIDALVEYLLSVSEGKAAK